MRTSNLAVHRRLMSYDYEVANMPVPRVEMEEYVRYLFDRRATHGDEELINYDEPIRFCDVLLLKVGCSLNPFTPWTWRDFKKFIYGIMYGAGREAGCSASQEAPGVEPKHLAYAWRREVPWDPEGD